MTALLISAGFTALLAASLHRLIPAGSFPPAIFMMVFLCLAVYRRFWRLSDETVIRRFNLTFPELEDSAQLLLRAPQTLNTLEGMQLDRINQKLSGLKLPADPTGRVIRTVTAVSATMVLTYLIYQIPVQADRLPEESPAAQTMRRSDSLPAEIRTVVITIRPPAYTGKKGRSQHRLPIRAEAGSGVTWNLETTRPVQRLDMLLNNKERVSFIPANTARTRWFLKRQIGSAGFYQLETAGKLSEVYQMEVIPDQAPQIRVNEPAPHTVIDFGMPEVVALKISVTDDYALAEASLVATLASGKG
ncbi:MAG TPA: DUF4175 family protein, partial [Sphingobacteriaceae bacterium]